MNPQTVTFYTGTAKFNGSGSRNTTVEIIKDSTKNKGRSLYLKESRAGYYDQPLVVVDGKKMSASYNINDIDTENIESIHVLKGEGATKKYGEKAKGGAIEITLKRNKK